MKKKKDILGPVLSLGFVVVIGVLPLITGKATTREEMFTVLRAIALASSLNILLGYTGYVSFGHIVFFGFGGFILLLLSELYNGVIPRH